MDPSMFQYAIPSELPQESKLVTYMGRGHNYEIINKIESSPIAPKKMLVDYIPSVPYLGASAIQESPSTSPKTIHKITSPAQIHQESVGGTTYFYSANPETIATPINAIHDLPETVGHYMELQLLEPRLPGTLTSTYRCVNQQNGKPYTMRRIHSYSGVHALQNTETWKNINHPNIVKLNKIFTCKDFNDHSLIFIYDYHPETSTMLNKYLSNNGQRENGNEQNFMDAFSSDPEAPRPYTHQKNAMLRAVACGALLPESELWSILIQVTAALRTIHTKGLACRNLDPKRIIVDACRIRLTWCGVSDALLQHNLDSNEISQAQQDDLTALGRLALALACRSLHAPTRENFAASIDLVSRTYSNDLKNLILYLLTSSNLRRSVNDLMPMIGARFFTQVEVLEKRADELKQQLSCEVDNGRLFRILMKLGCINERPELNMDMTWSETGDRYMLKLFRDYLFHAVTSDGRPWLDQSHIVYCLNQLDSGSNSKVQLMSRDQQSVLVVSFAELKHCLEQAFDELIQASPQHQSRIA